MPDEGELHERTWMAFCGDEAVWGDTLVDEVHRNLALIANTIAKYEPVTMLVNKEDHAVARKLVSSRVELVVCPLNDLWMRYMGLVFVVTDDGAKAAVDFNFNGWTYRFLCTICQARGCGCRIRSRSGIV